MALRFGPQTLDGLGALVLSKKKDNLAGTKSPQVIARRGGQASLLQLSDDIRLAFSPEAMGIEDDLYY